MDNRLVLVLAVTALFPQMPFASAESDPILNDGKESKWEWTWETDRKEGSWCQNGSGVLTLAPDGALSLVGHNDGGPEFTIASTWKRVDDEKYEFAWSHTVDEVQLTGDVLTGTNHTGCDLTGRKMK